jgi:hypothetical protein
MLPNAKGKKEAQKMAEEWMKELNATADLMPNAEKDNTLDKTYKEYLKFQLNTGVIEKSTTVITFTHTTSTLNLIWAIMFLR